MPRIRSSRTPAARPGVILLVVISLLVLFFVVGLAFVIYSSAQATNARVWREGETVDHPDMDPEMLLSYFMGQVIYGTTNGQSALAANPITSCLGPNMYGAVNSTVPYAGGPNGGVPYTYPDRNNLYLGAIKAGNLDFYDPATGERKTFNGTDGAVLIPSYARYDAASGAMQRLGRPATLPAPADPLDGDVKNLAWSPGFFAPGSNAAPRFLNHDSHWMDLGFAVTTAPDGRRYKPLFAPLIIDLDNKVNVNVHGNIQRRFNSGAVGGTDPRQGRHTSHQGWGPWEVSLERILTARDNLTPVSPNATGNFEARRIFIGDTNSSWWRQRNQPYGMGRYKVKWGNVGGRWGEGWPQLVDHWTVRGPSYMPSNYDATSVNATGRPRFSGYWDGTTLSTVPSFGRVPSFTAFPYYSGDYDGGKRWYPVSYGLVNHPLLHNFFDPTNGSYYGQGHGQIYDIRDMEAVLRHGDTNSPALRCDLFHSCPLSLASAKARRLVTTHAFDWDLPGITPVAQPDPADVYQTVPGLPYPVGSSYNSEPYNAANARIQFGRVNLNRDVARSCMGNMEQQHESNWWSRCSYPPIETFIVADPLRPGTNFTVSKGRVAYFNTGNLVTGVSRGLQFIRAVQGRTSFAKDVFDYARLVTGAPDPNNPLVWTTLTLEQRNALRWLAQLSVNIVDFIDIDDNITPFRWKNLDPTDPDPKIQTEGLWVFGTELPRLVVNEVYADVVNHPADAGQPAGGAANNYRVRFWAELNNPLYDSQFPYNQDKPWGPGGQAYALPLAEGGQARLWVSARDGYPAYAVYKLVVCGRNPLPPNPDNVKGDPDTADPNMVKCEVTSWYDRSLYNIVTDPEPMLYTMGQRYPPWQEEINMVRPMDKFPRGVDEDNFGYYVAGPMDDFPGGANPLPAKPKATIRIKEDIAAKRGLTYEYDKANNPNNLGDHSVLLRRLCVPSMPPNNDPNSPTYNPYITVDYLGAIPVHDRVRITTDPVRAVPAAVADPSQTYSVGRTQPYAADVSQHVHQKPATALTDQPQHTMFDLNIQKLDAPPPVGTGREALDANLKLVGFAYHWLCHPDRPLISPMELLEVSAFKPHELTQLFAQGPNLLATNEPTKLYQHRAPWFDPGSRIYRLFEILSTTPQLQWNPIGGRVLGKININTIFDREIFHALFDPQPNNLFTLQDVDKAYDKMMADRSPLLTPGDNDRPFRGLSFDPAGGIDDTLLRMDRFDNRLVPPQEKRRLFEPEALNPTLGANRGHPYMKYEMLRKVANNITTRSNVFAIFLTVGFFEVNAANQPIAEVRKNEGRHVRHRMFAIVDRSNLSIASVVNPTTLQPILLPGQPGARPITLSINIPPAGPGLQDAQIPWYSGAYEGASYRLVPGDYLRVDSGINQEFVRFQSWQGYGQFRAQYTKAHPTRVVVSKADHMPGNPGPQSRFDVRNPVFQGVVRYFSITE